MMDPNFQCIVSRAQSVQWHALCDRHLHEAGRLDLVEFLLQAVEGLLQCAHALQFDGEDARTAATIRLALMQAGTPIGSYDLLIASQAIRHNFTIVTANTREFSRVPDLRWENWEA